MICSKLNNKTCTIASAMAGRDVLPILAQCEFCTYQSKPSQDINKVTVSLAVSFAINTETKILIIKKYQHLLTKSVLIEPNGPGTELKKLISWFPLPIKKNCRYCRSLENKMNDWGAEKCIEKKKYIINKLLINAKRHKIPTTEFILSTLLNRAIRNAKRLDSSSNNGT